MPDTLILIASAALAALPATTLGVRGAPAKPHTAVPDASLRALQSLFDTYVRAGKVPGIVAAVGRGDAPPDFVYAGRIADGPGAPDVSPDSLWRIYSMTKPITAIAAMMLIEDGKLRLDQPISDFIPAFKHMRVLVTPETSLDSRPAKQVITVRDLLTHTGGLTYEFLGTGPLPQEYKRLGLLGGRAGPEASKAQPTTLAGFADRVAGLPLLAEPGTEWHYSIGLDVLGRIIEVASGVPFGRFVQRRVLDPLGMTSTYWTVPRSEAGRLATLYFWQGEHRVPLDPGSTSDWLHPPQVYYGGSGLVSSSRDYDRFLRMLAGGGSIDGVHLLKRETVALALSNLLPPGVRVTQNVTPAPALAEGFGAGGSIYLSDVPHGVRAGTYGWFGAAGTFFFIDPAKRLRVSVMVNYFPENKWPLYADVVKALYKSSQ